MDQSEEGIEGDVEKEWTERVTLTETTMLSNRGRGKMTVDVNGHLNREKEGVDTANHLWRNTEAGHDGREVA